MKKPQNEHSGLILLALTKLCLSLQNLFNLFQEFVTLSVQEYMSSSNVGYSQASLTFCVSSAHVLLICGDTEGWQQSNKIGSEFSEVYFCVLLGLLPLNLVQSKHLSEVLGNICHLHSLTPHSQQG